MGFNHSAKCNRSCPCGKGQSVPAKSTPIHKVDMDVVGDGTADFAISELIEAGFEVRIRMSRFAKKTRVDLYDASTGEHVAELFEERSEAPFETIIRAAKWASENT